MLKILSTAVIAVILFPSGALAVGFSSSAGVSVSTCPAANPRDDVADDAALQACLNDSRVKKIALTPTPVQQKGYIVASGLKITRSNITLTSTIENLPAVLTAAPGLAAPMFEVKATGVIIKYIKFDGNKRNRTKKNKICCSGCDRKNGSNVRLVDCNNCKFIYSESNNALCGTALKVSGSNYEIAHSRFLSNGFDFYSLRGASGLEPWADGITLGSCEGGWVHDNQLVDSTDIGIANGGGRGCIVEKNVITQDASGAFVGFSLGLFTLEGKGLHYRSVFRDNTVTSKINKLDFGISIATHRWHTGSTVKGGTVKNNKASGAVINLAIDGYADGTVLDNDLSNPQGELAFRGKKCEGFQNANYTVAHTTACLQTTPRWFSVAFDHEKGTPPKCQRAGGTVVNTCRGHGPRGPDCGDGTCGQGETRFNCPEDCHGPVRPTSTCGDGTCSEGETRFTCPADCHGPSGLTTKCGDGTCSLGETRFTCPADCHGPQ